MSCQLNILGRSPTDGFDGAHSESQVRRATSGFEVRMGVAASFVL
jgi:hypothetical protein